MRKSITNVRTYASDTVSNLFDFLVISSHSGNNRSNRSHLFAFASFILELWFSAALTGRFSVSFLYEVEIPHFQPYLKELRFSMRVPV